MPINSQRNDRSTNKRPRQNCAYGTIHSGRPIYKDKEASQHVPHRVSIVPTPPAWAFGYHKQQYKPGVRAMQLLRHTTMGRMLLDCVESTFSTVILVLAVRKYSQGISCKPITTAHKTTAKRGIGKKNYSSSCSF